MWRIKLLTFSLLLTLITTRINTYAQDIINQEPHVGIEIPQVVDPVTIYDYLPEYTSEDVRQRLRKIESSVELVYNDKVSGFINYFAVRNRSYTRLMIQRKNLYFPIFEKTLAKYGLPDEIKYLAIVESGLNPKAVSRAGAMGLWQFMPKVGKYYGLKYDLFVDEKMNPEKSTEAACRYLKELYGMFHDWPLALASYNCGPGSLRRAIRKSGYKNGFWSIYDQLPKETRSYVPQFIAVMYVMNYAKEHNLEHNNLDFPMEIDTVIVNKYLDLEKFASLTKVCLEDIQKLNPELKRNAIPAYAQNYVLKIPSDRKSYLAHNRAAIFDSASKVASSILLASHFEEDDNTEVKTSHGNSKVVKKKTYHTVRKGEVLGSIADKYNVKVSEVKKWNSLRGNVIRKGQRLVIYKYQKVTLPATLSAKNLAQQKPAPQQTEITKEKERAEQTAKYHIVQPGDTLWNITQKYEGLTIEIIKKLNNLKDNNIKPGMKLVIG